MTDPTIAAEVARTTKFHDQTRKAAVLAANAGDDPALLREAALAQLQARRPAHALRLAVRALELDPGPQSERVRREADNAVKAAPRAVARFGEAFAAALYELVFQARGHARELGQLLLTSIDCDPLEALVGADLTRDPGKVCAMDLINGTLARMGAGGLDLRGDASAMEGVRRTPLRTSKPGLVELLGRVEVEGAPCEACSAPRWTFAHDDDLGEFCGVCCWPLQASALEAGRRHATVEQLEAQVAELRETLAARDKLVERQTQQVAELEGKLEKVKATFQGRGRLRPRPVLPGEAAPVLADVPIGDLQAQAAQALATINAIADEQKRRAEPPGEVAEARKDGQP